MKANATLESKTQNIVITPLTQAEQKASKEVGHGDGKVAQFKDGALAEALFSQESSLFHDNAGHLIVTDKYNHRIREIGLKQGVVSTIAGTSRRGFENGPISEAKFAAPNCCACGEDGLIYVLDDDNLRIRVIDRAAQTVTTLAGCGEWGSDDGVGKLAQLHHSTYMAYKDGMLYMESYNAIRQIECTSEGPFAGRVTTIAGRPGDEGFVDNAVGAKARFHDPSGMAFDETGQSLLVCDEGNNRIRAVSLRDGDEFAVSTLLGHGGDCSQDGPALECSIVSPSLIVRDAAGNLIIGAKSIKSGASAVRVVRLYTKRTGYVSTIEELQGYAIGSYSLDGSLWGFGPEENDVWKAIVRVDGLATSLKEHTAEFVRDVLVPNLPIALPKGLLELIAAYIVAYYQ